MFDRLSFVLIEKLQGIPSHAIVGDEWLVIIDRRTYIVGKVAVSDSVVAITTGSVANDAFELGVAVLRTMALLTASVAVSSPSRPVLVLAKGDDR